MTQNADNNTPGSRPYVNGLQEWVGESRRAVWLLGAWHAVSVIGVGMAIFRYQITLGVGAVLSLVVSTLIQFWRDKVAPEMRHKRGDST